MSVNCTVSTYMLILAQVQVNSPTPWIADCIGCIAKLPKVVPADHTIPYTNLESL